MTNEIIVRSEFGGAFKELFLELHQFAISMFHAPYNEFLKKWHNIIPSYTRKRKRLIQMKTKKKRLEMTQRTRSAILAVI